LVVLVAIVWWTFTYRVGDSTVAEHLERIGDTPEAKGLIDGAKTRIDPVLDEAKQRMIGEYIEAPTAPDSTPRPRVNDASPTKPKLADSDADRLAQHRDMEPRVDAQKSDLDASEILAANGGEDEDEDDASPPAMPDSPTEEPEEPEEAPADVAPVLLQPSTARTSRLPGRRP